MRNYTLSDTDVLLAYDPVGNIRKILTGTLSQTFSYDPVSRLTEAGSPQYSLSYQYDANGNRTQVSDFGQTQSLSYETDSNRLTMWGAWSVQHDAAGRIENDGHHQYQYDESGRLEKVDEKSRYQYNLLGERVSKTRIIPRQLSADLNEDGRVDGRDIRRLYQWQRRQTQSGSFPPQGDLNQDGQLNVKDTACIVRTIARQHLPFTGGGRICHIGQWISLEQETRYVYDGARLMGEYRRDGRVIQEYLWLGDEVVAVVRDGNVYYVHTDQTSTPRVITDAAGRTVWRWDARPFGDSQAQEDPDGDGRAFVFNLRAPGQYYDSESGLFYNYHRYYDPGLGRYITSDPIGLGGGLNTYAYVQNNPLTYVDPLGLETQLGISFNGTLFGGPLVFPNGGFSGGVIFGVSLPDSFSDWGNIQIYTQVQANGLVGAGWFAGGGASGVVGSTDGTLPGCSTSTSLHVEANAGWGGAAGGSIDFNQDGGGVTYSGRPFTGAGYGVMTAGGVGTTTTYATLTLRQVLNRFLR